MGDVSRARARGPQIFEWGFSRPTESGREKLVSSIQFETLVVIAVVRPRAD